MPPRFDSPNNPEPEDNKIDTSKRYDVFCMDWHKQEISYRNVLFKGIKSLFDDNKMETKIYGFIELELENGQSVFISRMSIRTFFEHGTEIPGFNG